MKEWLTMMGLTDKAFNKNFFIAVVLVLLFSLIAVVVLLFQQINEVNILQKNFAKEVAFHESDKRKIQAQCDSMRYLEYRFNEHKIDSISKIVYRILTKEEVTEK